ncbi:hypothetical protein SEA_GILGAMESH_123 [Streptomyces phage Gilgamesh]|uniref:Uncharacterized protein n=1 Tax=Streptomyces phage Gilgamesh TaxID=2599890 RepID=A0A5J6TRA2_9CAUD|nr:hypothetical protein QEH35_gp123 [Streptomyces phage Gilgamesh]QFG13315.1 hypothetical protein SEA_GILGAMESH_123 [Streptomyces phage Gilgamesh]
MSLPPWLRSRIPSEPTRTFVAFTDEVARLLELPPASQSDVYVRQYDTDRVWMVWRYKEGGASLFIEQPYGELRDGVWVRLYWHESPHPETVAAMVRAYERRVRGERRRPSRLARLFRRR